MSLIAVAALSARMLAEAARDDGFEVAALDLFGDVDTRRASSQCLPIGRPGLLHIDDALVLAALGSLAQRGAQGWIAGSGFEGRPELLERGAALLPLIGTKADAVRRVRDPRAFFDFLDAEGIAHPPVRMTAPADGAGWLVKDANGCGGGHIRRLAPPQHAGPPAEPVTAQRYFQREMKGTPMSATFIGNGSEARVLGFNRLIVRSLGTRPFVFCGAVGPVPLPDDVAARLTAAVHAIVSAFSLRGLGSMDFMLDGDAFGVLEVNPRPPASMALYGSRHFQFASQATCGAVAAHVRACLQGELPEPAAHLASDTVKGTQIVFAPRPMRIDEPAARRLAERADCHDLPSGATHFASGDPICSVSAAAADAERVHALLDLRRQAVHQSLEIDP